MCLDPGLKLLSTSRLRQRSTTEDDISLYFLKKKDEDFPRGSVWNMKKNRGVRLVEDNFNGVSSILGMKSPECLKIASIRTRTASDQIFAE
jgi:hypothetical protein